MALTYGFFNSVNHDRTYDAVQMSSIFDGIIEDGVFQTIGSRFAVSATSGMGITVGSGRAWFDHTWTYNDSALSLTVPAASALLPRIDAVVLEINSDVSVRANSIKIVSGTAASTPVKPTMANTSTLHQHPLAYIKVGKGTTSITQANITNAVGTSECPFVTGPLETMQIDQIVAQWEQQFTEWFDDLNVMLDGDVAANLAGEILDIQNQLTYSTPRIPDSGLFGDCSLVRWGKVCVLYVSTNVSIPSSQVATYTSMLPSGYRPATQKFTVIPGMVQRTGVSDIRNYAKLAVSANGDVRIIPSTDKNITCFYAGTICYLLP